MILFDKEEIEEEEESYLIDDEFEFHNELDPELVHHLSVEGRTCDWELFRDCEIITNKEKRINFSSLANLSGSLYN